MRIPSRIYEKTHICPGLTERNTTFPDQVSIVEKNDLNPNMSAWYLNLIERNNDIGFVKTITPINFCPFCGRELNQPKVVHKKEEDIEIELDNGNEMIVKRSAIGFKR